MGHTITVRFACAVSRQSCLQHIRRSVRVERSTLSRRVTCQEFRPNSQVSSSLGRIARTSFFLAGRWLFSSEICVRSDRQRDPYVLARRRWKGTNGTRLINLMVGHWAAGSACIFLPSLDMSGIAR